VKDLPKPTQTQAPKETKEPDAALHDALDRLHKDVQQLEVRRNVRNGLLKKIERAHLQLDRERYCASASTLRAFVFLVESYRRIGKLSAKDAADLNEQAWDIIYGLEELGGCHR
jgi:hypothetical protein